MKDTLTRSTVWAGPLAVALWIAGLAVTDAPDTSTHKTDAQILGVYQHHANSILLGSWLFMLGSVCFLWFVGVLRGRMAEAEGGSATFTGIGFGGAVAATVFGIGTMAGPLAVAINKDHVSAATAGALTHIDDLFFVGAELTLIAMFAAFGVVAFRTGLLPKWWAALMWLVAVVLVIGPIGWAALIFGTPVWVLGTTVLVLRRGGRRAVVPATA